MNRRHLVAAGALLLAGLLPAQAQEQAWPNQMVRIVVPFSAGSVTDTLARSIGEKLAEEWRQQVIVENRPGVPGTASVAKGPADGHTLMLTSNGHAVIGSLNRNLSFDPVADFVGVAQVASVPFVLVAAPDLPVKSVAELTALARQKPGTLNIALPGLGSAASIASELFRQQAGVEIVGVPYKGAPEAHSSVMRGDAHIFFSAINIGAELIQAGKVRPLAVSSDARLAKLPDVPTLKEAGLTAFRYDAWFGVLAPAGTPRPVVERINRDVAKVLALPEIRTRMERQGIEQRTATPEQLDAAIRNDTARFAPLFKTAAAPAN